MNRPKRHHFVPLLIYIILSPTLSLAGKSPGEVVPTSHEPPPELRQLDTMIGVWDTTTVYRPAPDARTFEGRSVERVRWSASKQFVISDNYGMTPGGWKSTVVITTWNPVRKEYAMLNVSPTGEPTEASMVIQGKTRNIVFYSRFEDRLIRNEMTVEFVSDAEYKFRSECTDQGAKWVFCVGSAKRRAPSNQSNPRG